MRTSGRLSNPDPARVNVMDGDVLDGEALKAAMAGQNVVYANLSGAMAQQARVIVDAMRAAGLKRLLFITAMGIYGEVPGERYRPVFDQYRDSAAVIEASDLDYAVLRPGGFDQNKMNEKRRMACVISPPIFQTFMSKTNQCSTD